MLEEVVAMEKKPFVRPVATSQKSAVPEGKGKQESGNHGKVNRANWKREIQPKQHGRPEVARRPSPQKTKALDNRPQPRRNLRNGHDWCEVAVNSDNAEVGSPLKPGSRKVNLNHLLNFRYLPRDTGSWVGSRYQEGHRGNKGSIWTPRKHKYNKEQFLQANCQFVVQEGANYGVHAADPDLLVDWKFIEQVRLLSHEVPSCPICLYPPVAAKITRCGHIYCWPCVLHYLALSDKTWRKCPICFESVYKTDLKSVVALPAHQYCAGEEISMRLMKRERGSVMAMPKMSWRNTRGRPLQVCDEDMRFSKLLLASKEEVLEKVIAREKCELATALSEDPDCPEACFIESALQNLSERNDHLGLVAEVTAEEERAENKLDEVGKNEKPVEVTVRHEVTVAGPRRREESSSADSLDGFILEEDSVSLDPKNTASGKSRCNSGGGKDTYYFYQSSDGQNVYLHSLNVRILVQQYGCLENCPDVISGKIVEKDGTSMSEAARNRLRYLGHLPLTAEFEVVELTLEPPLVSKEVTDSFTTEIESRQRKRNRRERDENRRERFIQMEVNRKMGKFPVAKLHLDSLDQFPTCQSADEASGEDPHPLPPPPPPEAEPAKERKGRGDGVPSFAQMLRSGKSIPALSLPCSPQHVVRAGKGWKNPSNSDSDSEGHVHAPEFHLSFGEAIQAAMDKAAMATADDTGRKAKKKKKGRQKLLLFSNAAVRGN